MRSQSGSNPLQYNMHSQLRFRHLNLTKKQGTLWRPRTFVQSCQKPKKSHSPSPKGHVFGEPADSQKAVHTEHDKHEPRGLGPCNEEWGLDRGHTGPRGHTPEMLPFHGQRKSSDTREEETDTLTSERLD